MLIMRGDMCPECNQDSLILVPGYPDSRTEPGAGPCICCEKCDYADDEYVDWDSWEEPAVRLTDTQN